tara:strand:+ start:16 stop:234 length:219 start_codon:yes stop_codon:yes gene_type:complete
VKAGDLIRTTLGRFGTIVRGPYTYRFMESQDWEMVDAGMGHLAGLYGTAVDVTFTDSGKTNRLRPKDFKVVK